MLDTGTDPRELERQQKADNAANQALQRDNKTYTLEKLLNEYCDYLKSLGRISHAAARSIFRVHVIEAWPAVASLPANIVTAEQILGSGNMNDNIDISDEKYEEALAYLREQDEAEGGGSYFDEVATILEELLFRVSELQEAVAPKKRLTKAEREAAAIANVQQTNAAILFSTRSHSAQTARLKQNKNVVKKTK